MDPILIPTWITTLLLSWQMNTGAHYNAKYSFVVDTNDSSIVVMNSQTGKMWRCSKELEKCEEPK